MVLERTSETVIIAHYAEDLGQPEPFQPIEGLVLHLSTLPTIEVVVCDDDLVRGYLANANALGPAQAERLAELREVYENQSMYSHAALFEVRDRGESYRPPSTGAQDGRGLAGARGWRRARAGVGVAVGGAGVGP